MDRRLFTVRAARRWMVMLLSALMLVGGFASIAPAPAAAGMAGEIVVDGAPLYADHDDFTVIEWMDAGTWVDHFYGPYEGLYEIRYNGTVGWTEVGNVDFGSGSDAGSSADTSSSGGTEQWIDVDRSSGAIRLYVGDDVQYVAYGILSQSQGEDYYATASGTWLTTPAILSAVRSCSSLPSSGA